MENLDGVDRRILDCLMAEGRITMTELAERVGLSKTPVQARVRRMEEAGVIRGYQALVDPVRLGLGHIAFVQVTLSDTRIAALEAFSAAARALPEVEQCHMIAGGFDYLMKVRTRDIAGYRKFLGEKLSALPHVASTTTFVVMETVKEPGTGIRRR